MIEELSSEFDSLLNHTESLLNTIQNPLEPISYDGSYKFGDVRGSLLTTSKYQSHLAEDTGIKIFTDAPEEIKGDTGTYFPTDNAEPASPFNGVMWTTPANAYVDDTSYTTSIQGGFKYTIWKTFAGLQTAIPDDATITGITVKCYASADIITSSPALNIYLTKDGVNIVGTDRNTGTLTASDDLVVAGGSTELWGTTWAKSDFGSNFGVMISGSVSTTPSITYSIDYIQVVVHYTIKFTDAFGDSIADAFMELWNGAGQSTLLYLKRNTLDFYFDKANLNVLGSLTVTPPDLITGNTGHTHPTSYTEPAGDFSGYPWTNPENVYGAGSATASQGTIKYSMWDGFGLVDLIPNGATITGIKVECYANVDTIDNLNAEGRKLNLQLTKDSSTVVGNADQTKTLTTDGALVSAGGDGSLWGTTWLKGDFGSGFGVMINGNGGSTPVTVFSIDYIQITVYYTTTTDSNISSNILPGVDDTYDLGSGSVRYSNIYARRIIETEKSEYAKIKTVTETVIQSNVLQNDDDLFQVIGGNEKWLFEFVLFVMNSGTYNNMQVGVTIPTSATMKFEVLSGKDFNTDLVHKGILTVSGETSTIINLTLNTVSLVILKGSVISGNTGTVQLQWSQCTAANSETLFVYSHSYMKATKV